MPKGVCEAEAVAEVLWIEVPEREFLEGAQDCEGKHMTYAEKLKDPRWQRKRLEIMEASKFSCSRCSADDATLHVHHCYYEKGLMPWEYPNESLKCLCDWCHGERQEVELIIQKELCELTTDELGQFLGIIYCTKSIGVDVMKKELDSIFT